MTSESGRISLVTPGFPPQVGGVETVVYELASALRSRGHDVHVYTHEPRRGLPTGPMTAYPVTRFKDWTGSRRFEIAPGLWYRLRRDRRDLGIVHAHSFHGSAALAAAAMTDGPLVFTPHFHGVGHTRAAKILHLIYDRAAGHIFDRAEVVTCVSQAEADLLIEWYPETAGKTVVVPNGLDVEGIRSAEPFVVDRPVVLIAGRLEDYKQVDLAVASMRHLPDLELVICGLGPAYSRISSAVDRWNLQDRVRLLGFVPRDRLRRWQRTASVSLSLSRHEAFDMVALEAAVAGSRVVASAIPAHTEHSDFLRLVSVQASPEEVAAAIILALANPLPPIQSGAVLTWPEVCERMEAVYERALRGAT